MINYIKKFFKLGCFNPKSDKYYKGYRYKKDKEYESWYNENTVMKVIGYWEDGNKCYEIYFNKKFDLHNEDGYARQNWKENGEINSQEYWLNGQYLTEKQWGNWTGKFSNKEDLINHYLKHEMYEEIIKLQEGK